MLQSLGLQGLSAEDMELLRIICPTRTYSANDCVFVQDDIATFALLLIEGHLTVSIESDGKKCLVGDIWPGEILGETALLNTMERRSATVISKTESKCLELTIENLERMQGSKALMLTQIFLMKTMAKRLRATDNALEEMWEASKKQPQKPSLKERLVRLLGLL